ncbi:uncharacterized protein VTP21DRAFT_5022 [Calcarisporiella thermophila]|uniref:uncharacterized protein n=1 Tax=Calcarisporiella thermophila TaxID=911321 RepID=UPI0037440B04
MTGPTVSAERTGVAAHISTSNTTSNNNAIGSPQPLSIDDLHAQLVTMGFEDSIAQLAIQENPGSELEAVIGWIVGQQTETVRRAMNHDKASSKYSAPKKGILKSSPQITNRATAVFKRDWFSSLNAKLNGALQPASHTNINTQHSGASGAQSSFLSNALKKLNHTASNDDRQGGDVVPGVEGGGARNTGLVPPVGGTGSLSSHQQTDPLVTSQLKRVRFARGEKLTHYANEVDPEQGREENSDAYQDAEHLNQAECDKGAKTENAKAISTNMEEQACVKDSPSTAVEEDSLEASSLSVPGTAPGFGSSSISPSFEDSASPVSPAEALNFYLTTCKQREEPPLDRVIQCLQRASTSPDHLELDLTGAPLERHVIEPLADLLTLRFGLRQLILDECGIENECLRILLHSLVLTDEIEVLSLAGNRRIKADGFKYIAIYMNKSENLRSLNLSNTYLDKKAAQLIAQALSPSPSFPDSPFSRLETLKLDNCGVKLPLLEVLAPAIRRSALRTLSLRNNKITHQGAVWLGVILRDYEDTPSRSGTPTLATSDTLSSRSVGIGSQDRAYKRGLEVLDVCGNDLRTNGVQYVAQSLRRNRSLRELLIADNRIDSKGLTFFAEALKRNQSLEILDLNRNPLSTPTLEGIHSLKNALTLNRSLRGLFLAETGLTSEGAIALAESITETKHLQHLDLTGNPRLELAGVLALSVSVKMNWSLTCLDVNVPPNHKDMARLSREIVSVCIRNAEAAQNPAGDGGKDRAALAAPQPLSTYRETERLAEIARLKSEKDFPKQSTEVQEPPRVADERERDIKHAEESVAKLEELVELLRKSRAREEECGADTEAGVLYAQCSSLLDRVRAHIRECNGGEEAVLNQLLSVNDRIAAALEHYRDAQGLGAVDEKEPEPLRAAFSIGEAEEDDTTSRPLTQPYEMSMARNPELTVNTSDFVIADEEEEEDDASYKSASPLELVRKVKEMGEGEALRRARSVELEEEEESERDEAENEKSRTD